MSYICSAVQSADISPERRNMNKLAKLVFAASAIVAFSAQAQTTDIQAKKPYSAYAQDSRGTIVRSGSGLCWHDGYWTPADSVPGGDGALAQAAAPAPAPRPAPPVVVAP